MQNQNNELETVYVAVHTAISPYMFLAKGSLWNENKLFIFKNLKSFFPTEVIKQ